ncbi:lysophospholipid acyltransferase family protein [Pseudoramibacter alactolyticus]|uniref:lysophospholipid acyltransferase family protein n=1 Tax=Pseudoramibacter alactolyticus TaxID=113287 RepID=UPI00248DD028|nr:lysophospholipid acyltransferase family protein [Pseudoramibacter alactolyticus]
MIYRIAHWLFRLVNWCWINVSVEGRENIPKSGRAVVCANHTYWYDPLLIDTIFPIRRPIYWMAKKEIFSGRFVSWILTKVHVFPVDRHHVSVETLKTTLGYLRNDEQIGIFPEGTRVKKGQKVKPADGFVVFAQKTRAPILPVHITGEYKWRGKVKVTIGEPIWLTEYYGKKMRSEESEAVSEHIMAQIYAL